MKKIKVIRLENKAGLGPFRGGHRDEADYLKGHKGIRICLVECGVIKKRIFKKKSKKGWLCGWSSEITFNSWMNGKEEFFSQLGYFKVEYEVSSYHACGNQTLCHFDEVEEDYFSEEAEGYQVFFDPKKAIKIK